MAEGGERVPVQESGCGIIAQEVGNADNCEELRRQNKELKDRILCYCCRVNLKEVFYMACGHLLFCRVCDNLIRARCCPRCGTKIKATIQAQMC